MENIETLNERLEHFYGHFEDGRVKFRLVWSDDQYEVRFGEYENYSESGIYLGTFVGHKFVPRYPYMPFQWVLEHLIGVPEVNEKELGIKASYEPVWGFSNLHDRDTPPWEIVKQIIDTLHENIHRARSLIAKYKESGNTLDSKEAIESRVEDLKKELFTGEADDISMALHRKEAVIVPGDIK